MLARTIPEQHPNPFFSVSRDAFEQAVAQLDEFIPELSDIQIAFELAKLVALVGAKGRDGHTTLGIHGSDVALPLHYYPLHLYWFSEGIFVVNGLGPHRELIGSRVLRSTSPSTATISPLAWGGAYVPGVSPTEDGAQRDRDDVEQRMPFGVVAARVFQYREVDGDGQPGGIEHAAPLRARARRRAARYLAEHPPVTIRHKMRLPWRRCE